MFFIGYDLLEDWLARFVLDSSGGVGDVQACLLDRHTSPINKTVTYMRVSYIEGNVCHYWQMVLGAYYKGSRDQEDVQMDGWVRLAYAGVLSWLMHQWPLIQFYEADGITLKRFAREHVQTAVVAMPADLVTLDGGCRFMHFSKTKGWVYDTPQPAAAVAEWREGNDSASEAPDPEPADDDGDDGGEYSPPGGVGLPKEESDADQPE